MRHIYKKFSLKKCHLNYQRTFQAIRLIVNLTTPSTTQINHRQAAITTFRMFLRIVLYHKKM